MKDPDANIQHLPSDLDWTEGPIEGCHVEPLEQHADERGWLAEFFRHDELDAPLHPAMGYVSLTHPGIARGPHAHHEQTDLFVFASGRFRLYLWDARADAASLGRRQIVEVGVEQPTRAIVPPGVVHGYKNIGDGPGLIINCPNQLYAGENKSEPVDEIRFEERDDHPFRMT